MEGEKRAVVLLSGGLDSATTLALARQEGFACYALSFDYGQRHRGELLAARAVAETLGAVVHKVATLDMSFIGGSALTDMSLAVPQAPTTGIPITYVPARNTVFLAMALAWAEVLGAYDIFIGVNAVDYSGYPDCRPAFLEAFQTLANLATKAGVEGHSLRVRAPLLDLTKAGIIKIGTALGVNYGQTLSCYAPSETGRPCGVCDACRLRAKGFAEAGLADPAGI
ncbi:MAG TPA: 7-cyano-7-deazaguanine synthase QueC [Acidiferrobacter sp.]|nr:7-cyano-7-deazaguanine synthase QueC [Acidiferrobacter sp.]